MFDPELLILFSIVSQSPCGSFRSSIAGNSFLLASTPLSSLWSLTCPSLSFCFLCLFLICFAMTLALAFVFFECRCRSILPFTPAHSVSSSFFWSSAIASSMLRKNRSARDMTDALGDDAAEARMCTALSSFQTLRRYRSHVICTARLAA